MKRGLKMTWRSPMFILLTMLLSTFKLSAQTPCLTVDTVLGCEPLTITVTNCSGSSAIYDYEYDGVTPKTESKTSHTYTVTDKSVVCQNYSIFQIIGTSGSGALDSNFRDIVRVCQPVAPEIDILLCADNQILIETTDTVYSTIRIDLGDNQQLVMQANETATHQYASSGAFTITAEGLFDGSATSCGSKQLTINVREEVPPADLLTATINQTGMIDLTFQLSSNVHYRLEEKIGTGSYQEVQVVDTELSTFQLTGKNPSEEHTYRIGASDPCVSTIHYSALLPVLPAQATAEGAANAIRWTSYQNFGVNNYQVMRDGFLIATLPANATEFLDMDISCGQEYCYQLLVNMDNNRLTTVNFACIKAVTSNQPIEIKSALASIDNGQATINWELGSSQGIASMVLYKSTGFQPNGHFADSVTVSGNQYVDLTLDPTVDTVCYQLVIRDSCGNSSQSDVFCNLVLAGRKQGLDNLLTWHEFVGLGSDVEFVIELLHADGTIKDTYPTLSATIFDHLDPSTVIDEQVMRYRLKAVSINDPSLFAYSNVVEIVEKLEVLIPEAFTPNNDGLNDVLEIQGNFISSIQLDIYNRWGAKVFTSENIEDFWDGMYKGKPVPQGPYSYFIQGTDSFGAMFTQKGTVLVLRN